MLLPAIWKVILSVARRINSNIIDVIGDQKWHRVRVHGVDLERYGRESGGIELIKWKSEAEAESVKIAWTLRWLLSPTAMEAILADQEKWTATVQITVASAKDKDRFIKNDIWLGGKCH